MADILTQMQDELDMLLHQMYTSLRIVRERAPPAAIPGQPLLTSFHERETSQAGATAPPPPASTPTPTPTHPPSQTPGAAPRPSQQPSQRPARDSPEAFHADVRELSRDLVLKEQQVEALIARLPGIGSSEREQVARMRALEGQLEAMEGEREAAVREREALLKRVEAGIGSAVGGGR